MRSPTPAHLPSRRSLLTGVLVGATAVTAGSVLTSRTAVATAGTTITDWIERGAVPLSAPDPAAPLTDLRHLRRSIDGARIVGLGEATHGTAELTRAKHRVLRYLVEELGFRSIAWEDDWSLGTQLNDYVLTGRGDLAALMAEMSTAWRSEEAAAVFEYLREYNSRTRAKVRFVGVEYFATRGLSYDAVDRYVARCAPDRLAELRANLDPLRPNKPMGDYVKWYWLEVTNKEPYIRRALAVYDLVRTLPHHPADRTYQLALHHARQIHSFYESFAQQNVWAYRDARAAENLRWWHRFTGDKVIYWASSGHTANAPDLHVSDPPSPGLQFPNAGSYLRRWYGPRYLSVSFTFDRGTVNAEQPVLMPPALPTWFESELAKLDLPRYSLDLRRPATGPVDDWLHGPAATRGFADPGNASAMTGGSLRQWFDLVIHQQTVTPVHPL